MFPLTRLKEGYEPNERAFDEYNNKQLTVLVNTKRGHEPKPTRKQLQKL